MTELRTYGGALRGAATPRPWTSVGRSLETHEVRRDGAAVDLGAFAGALDGFLARRDTFTSTSASDAWFSPVVHHTLRLTRAEAADKEMWCWLAVEVARPYVEWRWSSKSGVIADNRWFGPIHKQALARLWWGAELFRDGPRYSSGVFTHQDIANSVIHRPFVRNRPLAVSIERVMFDKVGERLPRKSELRPWIAGVNLFAGARSLDAIGLLHRDDPSARARWVSEVPGPHLVGPDDGGVSHEARDRAEEFLADIWDRQVGAEE